MWSFFTRLGQGYSSFIESPEEFDRTTIARQKVDSLEKRTADMDVELVRAKADRNEAISKANVVAEKAKEMTEEARDMLPIFLASKVGVKGEKPVSSEFVKGLNEGLVAAFSKLQRRYNDSVRDLEKVSDNVDSIVIHALAQTSKFPVAVYDSGIVHVYGNLKRRGSIDVSELDDLFGSQPVIKDLEKSGKAREIFGNYEINFVRFSMSDESNIDLAYIVPVKDKGYERRTKLLRKAGSNLSRDISRAIRYVRTYVENLKSRGEISPTI